MVVIDIDALALVKAYEALAICFIITIPIVNGRLIFTIARTRDFMYKPRSLLVISLAIGDIFHALFSLIVNARIIFEPHGLFLSCSLINSSIVYSMFLIHFVYGIGLIVLAIEMLIRNKRQMMNGKTAVTIVNSVIVSAVPWALGLVIILPLTMAGYTSMYDSSSDICVGLKLFSLPYFGDTISKTKAMYSVSVLLPACLAVVVCFTIMFIRLTPEIYATQAVTYPAGAPGVTVATQTTSNVQMNYPMTKIPNAQPYPINQMPPYYYQQGDQYPVAPWPGELNQPKAPYIPQPDYPMTQQYPAQSNVIIPAATTPPTELRNVAAPAFSDPGKEKNLHLLVSIVYFLCVVPYSAFIISVFNYAYYDDSALIIMLSVFYWLTIFRSLLTPSIWMACSRN